jgi:hypothetical protein
VIARILSGILVRIFADGEVVLCSREAFSVNIDASLSVGHLKEAIKEKKMYQFPADQLRLFLAKKRKKVKKKRT